MSTILIVDDVSSNRAVLVALLSAVGHRLIEAANGHAGLVAATSERPDLIITDVLMPVMDGYELVQRLHQDARTNTIPIIVSTAHYGQREARDLALKSGVAYVMTKPIEPDDVLAVVDRVLSGVRANVAALPSEFDREHLRLVTGQLSQTSEDLRAANARLRGLINIGLELASERNSSRLLQRVCAAAGDLFGATYVTLGVLSRHNGTLDQLVTYGISANDWIRRGDTISGLLETVTARRRTVRLENPSGAPTHIGLPRAHPDVRALIAAPVVSPARVYGWLSLVGNEGRVFTADDEQLLMVLGGQVGRIYENDDLYTIAAEERDRARQYFDTASVMLLALDVDGHVTLINRYGSALVGWSADELAGRDWFETCVPATARDSLRRQFRLLRPGEDLTFEDQLVTKSGEMRLVEWRVVVQNDGSGRPVGTLSSGADVTARRMLELQLRQAQKMEVVGRLTGGIAHDFNNLLTGVLGHCELLLDDSLAAEARHASVEHIQRAGESAARLTERLLSFSRKQIIDPRPIDLGEIVADIEPMLARLIGEDITLALRLSPELPLARADPIQIEQIVMNLVLNARDAMPDGGTVAIETGRVDAGDSETLAHARLAPGPYVSLTVTDTGTGMSADVQSHLFEPFFTTKPFGKGTGLGLATVHGIVTEAAAL